MSLVFGFDFKSRFPPCKREKYSVKFRSGNHLPLDIQWVLIRSLDLLSMRHEFSEKQHGSVNNRGEKPGIGWSDTIFVVSTLALGLKINFDHPIKWMEFQ